jgi:hypothetical protein
LSGYGGVYQALYDAAPSQANCKPQKNRGAGKLVCAPALIHLLYLQPAHEAQQSADGQHAACAACAVTATPNAIAVINSIIFNVFIALLL